MAEKELFSEITKRYNDTSDKEILELKNSFEENLNFFEKEFGLTYLENVKKLEDFDKLAFMKHLFGSKESNSLIYVIEYDKRFAKYGSISGGSAAKFPLWFGTGGQWRTGRYVVIKDEKEIEDLAPLFLDFLVDVLTQAKTLSFKTNASEKDYAELNNFIYEKSNELNKRSDNKFNFKINNIWLLKYMAILFPNSFSCWYSPKWLNKVASFLKIDVKDKDRLVINGNISLKLRGLDIPQNNIVQRIINKLLDSKNVNSNSEEQGQNEEELLDKEKYHNIILFGVPGTGKTYTSIYLAAKIARNEDPKLDSNNFSLDEDYDKYKAYYDELKEKGRIAFVTFHQNYSYEDFIVGIRPAINRNGLNFEWKNGIFKELCNKAKGDLKNNYCLIIDEINRGNISRIFGELITLIESSKRGEKITLSNGDEFEVPDNVFIIGTMNSSDKSISLIDVALRRRFNFFEIKIDPSIVDDAYRNFYICLNNEIINRYKNDDLAIGHSYFIFDETNENDQTIIDNLIFVLNFKIIPLLYEISFDNKDDVANILRTCLGQNYSEDKKYYDYIELHEVRKVSEDSYSFGRITVSRK